MNSSESYTQRFSGPVSQRMASRPRLAAVIDDQLRPGLEKAISEPFAGEHLALGTAWWQRSDQSPVFQGYRMQPLSDVVCGRYLSDQPLSLVSDWHFLTDQTGTEYPRQLTADLATVAEELDVAGRFLIETWSARMADFWSMPGEDGTTPWAWLAAHLRTELATALKNAQLQGTLTTTEAALVAGSVGLVSEGAKPYPAQAGHVSLLSDPKHLVPLLRFEASEGPLIWLTYSVQTGFERFATEADMTRWLSHMGNEGASENASTLLDPGLEQDLFTGWARTILEEHLVRQRALAIRLRDAQVGVATFTAAMDAFPAALLLDSITHSSRSQTLRSHLPTWLLNAQAADRLRYGLGLQRMLAAQRASDGGDFFAGLPTPEQYARERLIEQSSKDHPEAPLTDPDDVLVTVYERTDDALLSIAGGGGAPTYTARPLSLVALSLLNTGGRPAGWLNLSARPGKQLPAWLDEDAALALVRVIDVGSTYLKLLHNALTYGEEGARRRQVFKTMIGPQAMLMALQYKLEGQGFDEVGIALTARAFSTDATRASVSVGQLALVATPGAAPDLVTGMFVIEAPELGNQVLLYSPLGQRLLRQFTDRAALSRAIFDDLSLQHEVLTWLTDTALRRYRNGGLQAPHWLRFGLGSEFAPEPAMAPAKVSAVSLQGKVLDRFYDGVVQGLTLAADRQTVSNQESFWISANQVGWLIFNQLLPLFSGSAATAAWLIQLGHTLDEQANSVDIDQPVEFDNEDLILDLALTLLTEGVNRAVRPVHSGGVGQELPPPGLAKASEILESRWGSSQPSLTPALQARLSALAVTEPSQLPMAITQGPFRGLIQAEHRWLVRVDGKLFEVNPGDGEARVIDPTDRTQEGPWLRRDLQGHWRFDLRLRLRGGGPKRRIEQQRVLNEQLRSQASQYLEQIEHTYREWRKAAEEGDKAIAEALHAQNVPAAKALRVQEQQRIEAAFDKCVQWRSAYQETAKKITLPDYGKYLSTVLSVEINMCGYYLSHTREGLVDSLQSNEGKFLTDSGSGRMTAEQTKNWFAFLHEQAVGAAAAERWRILLEDRVRQLEAIPVFGVRRLEQLKPRLTTFRSRVQYQVLRVYVQLSLLEEPMFEDEPSRDSFHEALTPLMLGLNTHKELNNNLSVSTAEERELLDGVVLTYQAAEDTVQWLKQTLRPAYVTPGMDELIRLIAALRSAAEARLGELIKAESEPKPGPSKSAAKPVPGPSSAQRVIRTRNRGPLIAKVHKAPGSPHGEVAEVVSLLGDSVVARFSHDPEHGDWVQEAAPRAEPTNLHKADVDRLMHDADRRLEDANRQLEQLPRLAKVTHIPVELEELLVGSARELEALAERIERFLTRINETDTAGPGYASAELKAHALREVAQRLVQQGRASRIRLTKAALPTASRVRYLVEQGEASIRRLGERAQLGGKGKRKDIVQEYAINDAQNRCLWYAHFHYATLEAPDSQYLAAHLKTVSQRFVGIGTQMAQAASDTEVVKIYRSRIDPSTARELFLNQQ